MKKNNLILGFIPNPAKSKKILLGYIILALILIPAVLYTQKPVIQTDEGEKVKSLVKEVGKFVDLPNETPRIVTVFDADKLRSQPFFAKAENNDQVLIYEKAKKAILYRPSTKKLIEVAIYNSSSQDVIKLPKGQVAGAVLSNSPTATPTAGFSLKDLQKDKTSPTPTVIPTITRAPAITP